MSEMMVGEQAAARATKVMIRRRVLTFFGAGFDIRDERGACVGYCHQKAFRLREDIRVYEDETKGRELMVIAARQVIDFSAAYDVMRPDSAGGYARLGSLQRKGWSSFLRDRWQVLDAEGRQVGELLEDSRLLATVRRFVPYGNLVPQRFTLREGAGAEGPVVASYRQHFNPFIQKLDVEIPAEHAVISKPIVLALGVLLAAIEGRQAG